MFTLGARRGRHGGQHKLVAEDRQRSPGRCRLKTEFKKFLSPTLLLINEVGYLPMTRPALTFCSRSPLRKGSTVITINQLYKHWARIFNNDATITSAVLDRLLHHNETILIEGKSYRSKDKVTEE